MLQRVRAAQARPRGHRVVAHPGDRVLIIDDVLATGGTARAAIDLVEEVGGKVIGAAFLIELPVLGGRNSLQGCEVQSLLTY